MKRRIAAAAAFALLAFPSAALADATVQAVDDKGDGSGNRWNPKVVDIQVGEKVTWTLHGHAGRCTTSRRTARTGRPFNERSHGRRAGHVA